jgi:hypothetical protein
MVVSQIFIIFWAFFEKNAKNLQKNLQKRNKKCTFAHDNQIIARIPPRFSQALPQFARKCRVYKHKKILHIACSNKETISMILRESIKEINKHLFS